MSDAPRGPDWWLGTDGRWYPPMAPQQVSGPGGTPPRNTGSDEGGLESEHESTDLAPDQLREARALLLALERLALDPDEPDAVLGADAAAGTVLAYSGPGSGRSTWIRVRSVARDIGDALEAELEDETEIRAGTKRAASLGHERLSAVLRNDPPSSERSLQEPATAEPSTDLTPAQERGCAIGCGILALALVVWIVVIPVYRSLTKPERERTEERSLQETDAIDACHDDVAGQLKSPSTAGFENWLLGEGDWRPLSDTEGTYDGHVDAQNGFGATVRSEYTCAVSMAPDGSLTAVATLSG